MESGNDPMGIAADNGRTASVFLELLWQIQECQGSFQFSCVQFKMLFNGFLLLTGLRDLILYCGFPVRREENGVFCPCEEGNKSLFFLSFNLFNQVNQENHAKSRFIDFLFLFL